MIQCPHCQRIEEQVKVGHNPSGSQRCLCKVCRRKYSPQPIEHGYSQEVRQQELSMVVDGTNQRRIARSLRVSHQSVANWIQAHAQSQPDQPPLPSQDALEVSELDELFTFVGEKKKSTSAPM